LSRTPLRVGIVGTSWWPDSMYLPALATHPEANVVAVCGRDPKRTDAFATRWSLPHAFYDPVEMIEQGDLQALIVASANDSHYPITMAALNAGLHVLCEKPLAFSYAQAQEMATLATQKGVKHMTPFTYRYMPTTRYLKALIDEGYLGRPYHLNMRYYTGFGRGNNYIWRFDQGKAGAGALGDIGSHFLYLATWLFGEVEAISCQLGFMVERSQLDPEGQPYERGDDLATLMLSFTSGAQGVIQLSTLAYEDTAFGQTHGMEFHGSEGTLHHVIDWDKKQQLSGARLGQGAVKPLDVPDAYWDGLRRDSVHNTYRDVFRTQNVMARQFVSAIVTDQALEPDFHDGAYVQRLVQAGVLSHRERRWVEVNEIQ